VRVERTIDLLGEQMRTKEAGYTALQANLNQMLDTLRDGVLLFTADHRAVMVSDAVAYFLNRPEGELVGKRLEEIFDADTALGAAVLTAFANGEEVSAEGVALEDGRQVQFSLDRIDDGLGGQSMGTLVTLRDTDSVMQLGQELEVARRLAAIGSLTAGVGHEVKNPINAMVVHLELLRSKLKAEGAESLSGAHRHVEILTNEMQRLDRVVQTLADFSRPMELKLREQDLRHVVNAVVELTVAELQENGVQVVVDAPLAPVMVRVDAELIRQALLNLLLNAMQAMPGGGMVRVTLRREHPFAVLEVQDDGVGIPPEVLPRIFELYFTTKPKGSGIGLAMTYRILQLHGGALDVRSNADPRARDHGTTFTLRLPIAAGQAGETRKTVADPVETPVIVAGASRKGTGEQV
jgi:signal transduction histidine kinase